MKKLIIGMVIGLLIGTTGTVLDAQSETVQAVFTKLQFKVDNKEAIQIEPLMHNGTSYLPIRKMGEILGYDVGYQDETITFQQTTTSTPNESIKKDVSEVGTTTEEWMTLGDVLTIEGISTEPFDNENITIMKGDIRIILPYEVDRPLTASTASGSVKVKMESGQLVVRVEDLKRLGILD